MTPLQLKRPGMDGGQRLQPGIGAVGDQRRRPVSKKPTSIQRMEQVAGHWGFREVSKLTPVT